MKYLKSFLKGIMIPLSVMGGVSILIIFNIILNTFFTPIVTISINSLLMLILFGFYSIYVDHFEK